MERLLFDAAAAVAILFAALMVLNRNPVKSVLSLVVSFFFLAVTYVLLLAPFIAAIQVIVYAGAILVLFLFVLMLLNIPRDTVEKEPRPIQRVLGGATVLLFAVALINLLGSRGGIRPGAIGAPDISAGEIGPLARVIYSEYLLPFEALSVLLLAALVGAFVLVEREKRP
ncbi:MAG: NADH-quinone oxidoreductase subunit J [Acidobacteriota bacterium]